MPTRRPKHHHKEYHDRELSYRERYRELTDRYHFLPEEARELARVKKHTPPGGGSKRYPPAMLAMHRSRGVIWGNFTRRYGSQIQTKSQTKRLWRKYVTRYYERHRIKVLRDEETGRVKEELTSWIVYKDVHKMRIPPQVSVWEYYDFLLRRIPDAQKWDTPRSHRTPTREPNINFKEIDRLRWISELREAIKRNPDRREEFEKQIRNLGGKP